MSAPLSKRYLLVRGAHAALDFLHLEHLLMIGLLVVMVIANVMPYRIDWLAGFRPAAAEHATFTGDSLSDGDLGMISDISLEAPMRTALDFVARRYHVSSDALVPIFAAAQDAARERHLDPLLLIAVISIESRFNPYSQSAIGAQGLMQIVPRFHQEKIPAGAKAQAFLDPVTNVRVGARILQETIQQAGDLMAGLQRYGGATNDEDQAYANKVMAEKRLLDQAARREVRVNS